MYDRVHRFACIGKGQTFPRIVFALDDDCCSCTYTRGDRENLGPSLAYFRRGPLRERPHVSCSPQQVRTACANPRHKLPHLACEGLVLGNSVSAIAHRRVTGAS